MNNREIDRLIAEKVMGWEFSEGCWVTEFGPLDDRDGEWTPSTFLYDAWAVVGKFEDVRLERNKSLTPSVRVDVWNPTKVTAFADTVPRAICLAALKAVGVEVES